ncbi:MAG: hypothetical protein ACKVQA_23575 [Burkholderiales bacterium]
MMVRIAAESDLEGVVALYKKLRPGDPELDGARSRAAWREIEDNPNLAVVVAEEEGIYESVGFRGDTERGFVAKPGDRNA